MNSQGKGKMSDSKSNYQSMESVASRLEREEAIAALNKRRQGISLSRREIGAIRRYEKQREEEIRHQVLSNIPQKSLADMLGTSRKVLIEWEGEGLPRNSDRTYNLYSVLSWVKTRWACGSKDGEKNSPALERYRLAKAQEAEFDLKIKKGEFIDRDEVERGQIARIMAVKQVMFALPRSVAPYLAMVTDARKIEEYLTEKMRYICNRFAGVNDDE